MEGTDLGGAERFLNIVAFAISFRPRSSNAEDLSSGSDAGHNNLDDLRHIAIGYENLRSTYILHKAANRGQGKKKCAV